MYINSQSTALFPGEWILQGSTGYIFLMPDSTTPTNNGLAVIDVNLGTTSYSGWLLDPRIVSGASTAPELRVYSSPGITTAVYYNTITYSALVTNFANYLYVEGNTVGNAPGIEALGADTNIDIQVLPKGTGVFRLNYSSVALGGGAAPTFGTIGGSGPSAAGQAAWGKVKFGTTYYFMPLWST